MPIWMLPDHMADVLPSQARHIEDIRRKLLDKARCYGFELVIPPLAEHLASLLTGTGTSMDLFTFKLVDQYSGRTLGIRADTTPQAARIDAHILNRQGVCRLCYCGTTLHAQAEMPWSDREQLQFGAEIFGHAGIEAELEVLQLALTALQDVGCTNVVLSLSHAGVVNALLSNEEVPDAIRYQINDALLVKDKAKLLELTQSFSQHLRTALVKLTDCYGGTSVLIELQQLMAHFPAVKQSLDELQWLVDRLTDIEIFIDLADARGHSYYSGLRFAIYSHQAQDAIIRGGRYDAVGDVFGRARPACGMSLNVRGLADVVAMQPPKPAIRAPWLEDEQLRKIVQRLRAQGETVVSILPNHDDEIDEFNCDRELVLQDAQWVVKAI